MKMVGNNTSNYSYGIGAYIKGIFPVSQASDLTLELGANIFFLDDGGSGDGTAVVERGGDRSAVLDRRGDHRPVGEAQLEQS